MGTQIVSIGRPENESKKITFFRTALKVCLRSVVFNFSPFLYVFAMSIFFVNSYYKTSPKNNTSRFEFPFLAKCGGGLSLIMLSSDTIGTNLVPNDTATTRCTYKLSGNNGINSPAITGEGAS